MVGYDFILSYIQQKWVSPSFSFLFIIIPISTLNWKLLIPIIHLSISILFYSLIGKNNHFYNYLTFFIYLTSYLDYLTFHFKLIPSSYFQTVKNEVL